ncbi:MAG: phosphotransferase [Candidatus Aegiribacteria sp.]|nr:phosphotransferase [Candidatus Aegiribacteria sp.]MBD3294961.1 phosphotransferase [Candidatus Fermentibacteria bacterium]
MKRMSSELATWLRQNTDNSVTAEKLHGDVSGRRFWRVHTGSDTLILMDSGKIPIWPWIDIHELLSSHGFRVPEIIETNTRKGWVLQEDLGTRRLLDVDEDQYESYLDRALEILISMQRRLDPSACSNSLAGRRSFTSAFYMAELENTLETVFFRLLEVPMEELLDLQRELRKLCGMIEGAEVFVHRDYHSANLMVHEGELALLDWQDARFGPPAYDAVSLLRDSYRDLSRGWEARAKKFTLAHGSMNMFQMVQTACQRNLKAIGTFGFQYRKTGDTRFLGYIPRTFRYLADYSRICPQLEGIVDMVYGLLDEYHGEIDLRDFRSSNIPEVRQSK